MGQITRGHNALAGFIEEAVPGTTPAAGTLGIFGRSTAKVKFFLDRDLKEVADVGDDELEGFFSSRRISGIEVEYDLYNFTQKLLPFLQRDSIGTPRAFTLEWRPNVGHTSPQFFRARGMRPQVAKLMGKVGEQWKASVVFTGGSIIDPVTVDPIAALSRELKSAIAVTALSRFDGGAITLGGSAWATLLGELSVEFNHGTQAQYTTGNPEPVPGAASASKLRITGSADISLDEGAQEHYSRVDGDSEFTLTVPFGSTGAPKLDLTGVRFGRWEAESGLDVDLLRGSQPFSARTFAAGTV